MNTPGAATPSLATFFLMTPRFPGSAPAAPPAPASLSRCRPPCALARSRSLRAVTSESLGKRPKEPKQGGCGRAASVGLAEPRERRDAAGPCRCCRREPCQLRRARHGGSAAASSSRPRHPAPPGRSLAESSLAIREEGGLV